ncbi:MAG TPA: cation:proton antiporter [Gammaproteobacteria bacterium]|nr:cation:proton antiporter [Gammaproteobacteria bacterium]
MPDLFREILLIFTASLAVLAIFRRLRLSATLAYLAVGLILGPGGTGLISDPHAIEGLAEFGVVFLLFTLGLEFALPRLIAMRRIVLGLGGGQVLTCLAVFFGGALLAGLGPGPAFVAGSALALSSTTIVTRELAHTGELHGRHGQLGVGVLLLQDLVSVFLLVGMAGLANGGGHSVALQLLLTLAKAAVLLALLAAVGKWILPRVFQEIARAHSDEMFVLAALVVALLAAVAARSFGLSMALGAFIAGMMLGESHYRHQIEAEIRPFRDILLGLFFVSVGMLLDLHVLSRTWPLVLLVTLASMGFKALVVTVLARRMGESPRNSVRAGVVLAQGGEFGFAVLALGAGYHQIGRGPAAILVASIVLSMAVTPLLIRSSNPLARRLYPPESPPAPDPDTFAESAGEMTDHVIIAGYGRVGQTIARFLQREGVPFIAVDSDPRRVHEASIGGETPVYGDARRHDLLRALGIEHARLLVISFDAFGDAMTILRQVRALRPELPVLVRTADDRNLEALHGAGATEIVPETLESSLMLVSHVLVMLGYPAQRVLETVRAAREQRYQLLHGFFHGGASRVTDARGEALEMVHAVPLPEAAHAVGHTLAGLHLDDLGVTVQALRRESGTLQSPGPEVTFGAGDIVVLRGSAEHIETAETRLLTG